MSTTEFQNALLDYLFRGSTFTMPANWYVLLDTTSSGSTPVEPTYTGYARVAISRASGSWTAASSGQSSNVGEVRFPQVPVGYVAGEIIRRVWLANQAASSGQLLAAPSLLSPAITLEASKYPVINPGAIVLQGA